jgi:hypothetical protein
MQIDIFDQLFLTENFDEQENAIKTREISSISNSSSNSETDFVAIDENDLYPDVVSSSFLFFLRWLTASVDCFYLMTCNKSDGIINRSNGCSICDFFFCLSF